MQDKHGRSIGYLRLSITQQCPMACTYCRPVGYKPCASARSLTPEQIIQMVSHLSTQHGVSKVRLTGGEPSAHPQLLQIMSGISQIETVTDLAMTTGGLTLARCAEDYVHAGLSRVNVSLDSLNAQMFKKMTGVDGLDHVLRGIDTASEIGLSPLKLNTVVLRGHNDDELPELVRFAAEKGVPIRFIELMPMGPLAEQWTKLYVSAGEMRIRLDRVVQEWLPRSQGADSAEMFDVVLEDGLRGQVGFITPMSCNFCADCNRLRITSDGSVYPCLMDNPRGSVMAAFDPMFDTVRFDTILHDCMAVKAPEHPTIGLNVMTSIGG
ncbi:GTP 3',8-cyclase MoaA [Poriferisphaera sp. WC338]|uniref:GTP 3',8-cyclase MoaA n=1 Tax=Poriferisphaera sp. WC338 TaxID=3425129 RepID=UPI003D813CA9